MTLAALLNSKLVAKATLATGVATTICSTHQPQTHIAIAIVTVAAPTVAAPTVAEEEETDRVVEIYSRLC